MIYVHLSARFMFDMEKLISPRYTLNMLGKPLLGLVMRLSIARVGEVSAMFLMMDLFKQILNLPFWTCLCNVGLWLHSQALGQSKLVSLHCVTCTFGLAVTLFLSQCQVNHTWRHLWLCQSAWIASLPLWTMTVTSWTMTVPSSFLLQDIVADYLFTNEVRLKLGSFA